MHEVQSEEEEEEEGVGGRRRGRRHLPMVTDRQTDNPKNPRVACEKNSKAPLLS